MTIDPTRRLLATHSWPKWLKCHEISAQNTLSLNLTLLIWSFERRPCGLPAGLDGRADKVEHRRLRSSSQRLALTL